MLSYPYFNPQICPRKADRMANYRNRKGKLSINVMAMCGPDYVYDFVCARFPGSCHDSFIEKNSDLHIEYQVLKRLPIPNALVLGDSAYCRSYKWLCTPFLEGTLGDDPDKIYFNDCICGCRSVIEQSFGQIQSKFPCLGDAGIRFPDVKTCALYIQALFAFWNFIKRNQKDDIFIDDEEQDGDGPIQLFHDEATTVNDNPGNMPTNQKLFEKYFKHRI